MFLTLCLFYPLSRIEHGGTRKSRRSSTYLSRGPSFWLFHFLSQFDRLAKVPPRGALRSFIMPSVAPPVPVSLKSLSSSLDSYCFVFCPFLPLLTRLSVYCSPRYRFVLALCTFCPLSRVEHENLQKSTPLSLSRGSSFWLLSHFSQFNLLAYRHSAFHSRATTDAASVATSLFSLYFSLWTAIESFVCCAWLFLALCTFHPLSRFEDGTRKYDLPGAS